MFSLVRKRQVLLRVVSMVCGVGLLVFLVWQTGFHRLIENIARLGWGITLILALGGVPHLLKAWAWKLTFLKDQRKTTFPQLLQLRLASEGVGHFGALSQIFGESIRVSALSRQIPLSTRISSVTLDRGLYIFSGTVVSLVGVLAALFDHSLSHVFRSCAILFVVVAIVLLFVVALAVQRGWRILSGSTRFLARFRYLAGQIERKQALVESVEERLFGFHRDARGAFRASLGLNFLCHGITILEAYLICRLLGINIGALGAFIFDTLVKLVNVVGAVNPGNLGTYEGGTILIAGIFGIHGALGLTIAVTRRLRAIFWAAIGVACLIALPRGSKSEESLDSEMMTGQIGKRLDPNQSNSLSSAVASAPTALVLADSAQPGGPNSTLFRIGTLPVVLRTVLGLQRAGVGRIILCVSPADEPRLKRELLATGRLPQSIEWCQTLAADRSLAELLRVTIGDNGKANLLVVAGNTTYHPALLRDAFAWAENGDATALTSGDKPVGICILPCDIARVAASAAGPLATIEQLYSLLAATGSVERRPVQEDHWQRVLTPEDQIIAERKLDGWLVKPTDGIFARMNRKVSIPISRQLIRWPITPNVVSLFTLAVGLVSGISFALGGYRNVLVGAVLSVWASILDGCDGEIARLKLQESDFGCWLETVCDWLYYIFIFSGMAIGLARTRGPAYLMWAVLLLFGAITTFLVTGLGRRRLARERPEQYLAIWQIQAEKRRTNPILYIGRHVEFIVRRCFLPYAILILAVLNLTALVLVLSAVGANVAWLISLYSYRAFTVSPRPADS